MIHFFHSPFLLCHSKLSHDNDFQFHLPLCTYCLSIFYKSNMSMSIGYLQPLVKTFSVKQEIMSYLQWKLLEDLKRNRPFVISGHMVRNKFCLDAVGRKSYESSPTFLCFRTPTALFASQRNSFRTMWLVPAKGLFLTDSSATSLQHGAVVFPALAFYC